MAGGSVVRMVGPLAPYAPGFYRELRSRGYTRLSAVWQLRLMAHLSRWLEGEGLGAAFTPTRAEEFCAARRREGYTALLTVRGLVPLTEFLRGQGVLPEPPQAAGGGRGGAAAGALPGAPGLRAGPGGAGGGAATAGGGAVPRRAAGAGGARARGRGGPGQRVLRARAARPARRGNERSGHRAAFVPSVRAHRGAGRCTAGAGGAGGGRLEGRRLAARGDPATLARLLASCDRRTRVGRRDYAILLLLARLALRCGEVAGLELDDFGWRAAEVLVRGKGGRVQRLRLLQTWCRGRRLLRPAGALGGRCSFALAPAAGLTRGGSAGWSTRPATGPGCPDRRAPAAPHRGHRDAARRGAVDRGRPAAPARRGRHHGDLRQGRLRRAAPLAPPWPGGAA